MTFEQRPRVPAFVVVAAILAVTLWSNASGQEPTAQLPFLVFKANGNPMGPVLSTLSAGELSIGLTDPDNSNMIPVLVRNLSGGTVFFEGTEAFVFFEGMNCTGAAWVAEPASSSRATSKLFGRSYGIGQPSGGDLTVYRGTGTAPVMQPAIQSRFSNGACSNNGAIGLLVNATGIINITNDFPAPYTLE